MAKMIKPMASKAKATKMSAPKKMANGGKSSAMKSKTSSTKKMQEGGGNKTKFETFRDSVFQEAVRKGDLKPSTPTKKEPTKFEIFRDSVFQEAVRKGDLKPKKPASSMKNGGKTKK